MRSFPRPLGSGEFFGQLFGINGIEETHVAGFARFEFSFRGANDQPEHLRFGVIEDLAQEFGTDEDAAVLRDRQGLFAHANTPDAFDDEIEFLGPDMLVEGVGASWWESPQSGSKNLAPAPLKEVRVRNLHEVRWPPGKVIGLDEEISVYRFHVQNEFATANATYQPPPK
jgi:hypothetical protein